LAPVPDPADPAAPLTPPRPRRTRKFVLPEHHRDELANERAAEHIEAFLDGPAAAPRRRTPLIERDRRPLEMDTRPDWNAAFALEGARHARYGRPASVLLIEVSGEPADQAVDVVARRLTDAIRAEARETDRAMRAGPLSFRILLPETGARAARSFADRLDRAFRGGREDGRTDSVELGIEVGTASRTGTLEDAVADAAARLAQRSGPR
jgi:GGDEF domain-containing protein